MNLCDLSEESVNLLREGLTLVITLAMRNAADTVLNDRLRLKHVLKKEQAEALLKRLNTELLYRQQGR